jgi:eukaryotic-like serine/threonine-protein kinase
VSESDLEEYAKQRIGTVLRGKYRLDAVLGVGGMAAVYKATHRNQAEFAVKMLHPGLGIRQDVHTRFLREGYAANSVKHPGAVLVVDDDTAEDGAAFLVMELLDGIGVESLWARADHRLPAQVAIAIVVQLLDVLAAAHAKGIVHRDIKPANLFLVRDGTVKVLDFGIARARDALAAGAGNTGTGILLGTPAFMPPEQAMAKSSEIDAQTDVWAAGATLFTLLSGHVVHEGDNGAQLMIRAATAPARSLVSVAPAMPPAIAQVVDRALAFKKSERWASAAAMRDALLEASRAMFGEAPSKVTLAAQVPPADVAASGPTSSAAAATAPTGIAPTMKAPAVTPIATAPSPRAPLPIAPTMAAAGQMVGGTTAQPISASPRSEKSERKAKRRGFTLAIVAAVGVFYWVVLPQIRASFSDSARRPAPAGLVESASVAPPAAPPSIAPPILAPPPPPVSAAIDAGQALHSGSSPATHSWAAPNNVPPRAPKPSPGPANTKPNCNPNFTLDSEGNKHFKPECFPPSPI